jgi:hypothetical protein
MAKKERKPLEPLKQAKLIYSGELMLFALAFIVLGILRLVGVISPSGTMRDIFLWITLVGGFLVIGNFIWTLVSPKHRKTITILDASLTLPVALFFIVMNIYQLISGKVDQGIYNIYMGIIFVYFGCDYLFQSIYHYYKPVQALLDAVELDAKMQEEEEAKAKAKAEDLDEIQRRVDAGEDQDEVIKEVSARRKALEAEKIKLEQDSKEDK